MKTIKYKNLTITPIMKPMLCWNNDENNAKEYFIMAKVEPSKYPWRETREVGGIGGKVWIHAKDLPNYIPPKKDEYPKLMMVSDKPITKDNPGIKKLVYHYNPRFKYGYECYDVGIQSLEDLNKNLPITPEGEGPRRDDGMFFSYAKDIIEAPIELTLEEIANKFNIDINQLRIKD